MQEGYMNMQLQIHFNKSKMGYCSRMVITVLTITALARLSSAATEPKGFTTPEEAVNAFLQALKDNNNQELLVIFGSEAEELIHSGDEVADQQRRAMFLKMYEEQHNIAPEGDKQILIVGKNEWPFPIPLILQEGKYVFDTAAGEEEILNRRIGRNELDVIQVMLAVTDAQREYAMKDRDGDGILEYAQVFKSDPGKKNGLYWDTKEGEPLSPLGDFVARAREEGYFGQDATAAPPPYHGYYYRILSAQGPDASGGAFEYVVNGNMIGGFAGVAYPAEYGNSGVMTFLVNHLGTVYQKDLGENTEQNAKIMTTFNPDTSWTKVD